MQRRRGHLVTESPSMCSSSSRMNVIAVVTSKHRCKSWCGRFVWSWMHRRRRLVLVLQYLYQEPYCCTKRLHCSDLGCNRSRERELEQDSEEWKDEYESCGGPNPGFTMTLLPSANLKRAMRSLRTKWRSKLNGCMRLSSGVGINLQADNGPEGRREREATSKGLETDNQPLLERFESSRAALLDVMFVQLSSFLCNCVHVFSPGCGTWSSIERSSVNIGAGSEYKRSTYRVRVSFGWPRERTRSTGCRVRATTGGREFLSQGYTRGCKRRKLWRGTNRTPFSLPLKRSVSSY